MEWEKTMIFSISIFLQAPTQFRFYLKHTLLDIYQSIN